MQQHANGTRIKDLAAQTLVANIGDVLKDICLTTGLKVEDETAKKFTMTAIRFLRNHYGNLTPGEISLAFTLNAAGELPGMTGGRETEKVDFFGSSLTIEHLGSVMFRYMQKRAMLAKKILEMQPSTMEPPAPTKEEQEMDDKLLANEYYKKYLNKEFSTVSLEYAHWIYDILDRFKLARFTVEQKKAFMEEANQIRQREISAPCIDFQDFKQMNKLLEGYQSGEVPMAEKKIVINYAKRIALIQLFTKWQQQDRKTIFE